MRGRHRLLLVLGLAGAALACNAGAFRPAPSPTARGEPGLAAGETETPALLILPTPLFTEAAPTRPVPTPLPADQRGYELCVSIASDSNGYGHASFLVPDPQVTEPQVAIVYLTPLWVPLQASLEALGLAYLPVRDHSQTAGGLTLASANYLESGHYDRLKQERCKFIVITPFYPDVAVDLASPDFYVQNLLLMVDGLTRATPTSRLLVLNFFRTNRAAFTVSNSGRGLRDERIEAFNAALGTTCADPAGLGGYPQVVCVDVTPFFKDMENAHVLGETSQAVFRASLYRENGYTPIIYDYFARYPDGVLIGDGIHLSQAGRERLAQRLAQIIFDLNDDF